MRGLVVILGGMVLAVPGASQGEPSNPFSEASAKLRDVIQREASGVAREHLGAQRAWTLWRAYAETGDAKKLEEIRALARANDHGALNVMGYLKAEGADGVARDASGAVALFRRAASEGRLPIAVYNLGLLTMKGEGVPADTKEAKRLFGSAAELVPQAAVRLALLQIEEGRYMDAWRTAKLAAQRGDPWGNYLCGKLAAMGSAGDQGLGVALDYLRRATEHWHPDAAKLMAELSERAATNDKTGIARVNAGMYRVISQAIRLPDPVAAARAGLPSALDSAEAEKASALAMNWLNTHPKPPHARNYNRPLAVPDA